MEDLIILQFGVMRLSCDCRDIYVQTIWGENPSADSEKPLGQKRKKKKRTSSLFFVFVTPLNLTQDLISSLVALECMNE